MQHRLVRIAGALIVVALAACSGGGSSTSASSGEPQPLPKAWPAAAKREATRVAQGVRSRDGAKCGDLAFLEPSGLETGRKRNGWLIAPRALGDCTVADEVVEVGVFASSSDRDRFMTERTTSLCRKAAATSVSIPPFAWTYGGTWTAQADKPSTARATAKQLDGRTRITRCDPNDTLGWTRGGITVVNRIGRQFSDGKRQVPCSAFALVDRERTLPGSQRSKVPAALGTCTITPDGDARSQTVYLAAFDPRSMPSRAFVASFLEDPKGCPTPLTAVAGDGWAVVAPTSVADIVTEATGGAIVGACPASAGSTATGG